MSSDQSLLMLVVLAGVMGLLIGSFLNVVIWRVPRQESLLAPSHCPACEAPVRPWQNIPVVSFIALRGRCARCRTPIGARYPLIELGTAVAFALVTWWYTTEFGWAELSPGPQLSWWLGLSGFLWFMAASIALTAIDAAHQRLPDAIVLPTLAVVFLTLGGSAGIAGNWTQLWTLLGAGAALFSLFFTIALVYPRGIGGGDVKLAPVLGVVLGYLGWSAVAVGVFAGFFLAATAGLALMLLKRATWRGAIAFGPWLIAGAWVGAVWGAPIMSAYLGWWW